MEHQLASVDALIQKVKDRVSARVEVIEAESYSLDVASDDRAFFVRLTYKGGRKSEFRIRLDGQGAQPAGHTTAELCARNDDAFDETDTTGGATAGFDGVATDIDSDDPFALSRKPNPRAALPASALYPNDILPNEGAGGAKLDSASRAPPETRTSGESGGRGGKRARGSADHSDKRRRTATGVAVGQLLGEVIPTRKRGRESEGGRSPFDKAVETFTELIGTWLLVLVTVKPTSAAPALPEGSFLGRYFLKKSELEKALRESSLTFATLCELFAQERQKFDLRLTKTDSELKVLLVWGGASDTVVALTPPPTMGGRSKAQLRFDTIGGATVGGKAAERRLQFETAPKGLKPSQEPLGAFYREPFRALALAEGPMQIRRADAVEDLFADSRTGRRGVRFTLSFEGGVGSGPEGVAFQVGRSLKHADPLPDGWERALPSVRPSFDESRALVEVTVSFACSENPISSGTLDAIRADCASLHARLLKIQGLSKLDFVTIRGGSVVIVMVMLREEYEDADGGFPSELVLDVGAGASVTLTAPEVLSVSDPFVRGSLSPDDIEALRDPFELAPGVIVTSVALDKALLLDGALEDPNEAERAETLRGSVGGVEELRVVGAAPVSELRNTAGASESAPVEEGSEECPSDEGEEEKRSSRTESAEGETQSRDESVSAEASPDSAFNPTKPAPLPVAGPEGSSGHEGEEEKQRKGDTESPAEESAAIAAPEEKESSVAPEALTSEEERLASGDSVRPERALHRAAFDGDADEVVRLLSAGHGLDRIDSFGTTPLHYAAGRGHLGACMVLIAAGARVKRPIFSLSSPLAKMLARKSSDGSTPLGTAVAGDRADVCEALVNAKASVNASMLDHAVQQGSTAALRVLLAKENSAWAQRALRQACAGGTADLVELLLSSKADLAKFVSNRGVFSGVGRVNKITGEWEMHWESPLVLAAQRGNDDVCELLLRLGESVDEECTAPIETAAGRGLYNMRPLHTAAAQGRTSTCRLLVERKADVNAPISLAVLESGIAAGLRAMVGSDEKIASTKPTGLSPLMFAAMGDHAGTCAALMDSGADVNVSNRPEHGDEGIGYAPVDYARRRQHDETVAILSRDPVAWAQYKEDESFMCPITRDRMADPVLAGDGTTYERAEVETFIRLRLEQQKRVTSPLGRPDGAEISTTLTPNLALRTLLDARHPPSDAVVIQRREGERGAALSAAGSKPPAAASPPKPVAPTADSKAPPPAEQVFACPHSSTHKGPESNSENRSHTLSNRQAAVSKPVPTSGEKSDTPASRETESQRRRLRAEQDAAMAASVAADRAREIPAAAGDADTTAKPQPGPERRRLMTARFGAAAAGEEEKETTRRGQADVISAAHPAPSASGAGSDA